MTERTETRRVPPHGTILTKRGERLVRQFEAGTLPRADWTHQAHVRVDQIVAVKRIRVDKVWDARRREDLLKSAKLELEAASVAAALGRADTAGLVVPVEPNRYFLPGHIEALVQLLTELSEDSADGLVTTTAYRDASGLGRNLAIAVLEHFDAQGLTRRTGNARRLIKSMG